MKSVIKLSFSTLMWCYSVVLFALRVREIRTSGDLQRLEGRSRVGPMEDFHTL